MPQPKDKDKNKKVKKVSLPIMRRVATVTPKSLNKEERTVEIVFTEGARVLRRDFWDGDFYEELGLKKSEVRMERLESGRAPLLDNHGFTDKRGVRSQIGIVSEAKLVPGKRGIATVRFSKRAEVEDIFQDVDDGILRNISVGYNVHSFEKIEKEGELPVFRATDWEPVEVSIVPAGADAGAQIRSSEETLLECEVRDDLDDAQHKDASEKNIENELENSDEIRNNKNNLNERNKTGGDQMTPEEIKKLKEETEKREEEIRKTAIAEGKEAESKRQTEIRSIVKKVGLKDELAEKYIKDEKGIEEVRTLVIDALAKKDEDENEQTRSVNAELGKDNAREARVKGMTSAILHRFRPKAIESRNSAGQKMTLEGHEISDEGRDFAYLSLTDMARNCLEGMNVRTGGLPRHKIVDMALNNVRSLHSISDFPEILANVANKTLRSGYLAAPKTWEPFTREVTVADFKQISRTNLGDAPKLEQLQEGSEVKRGTLSEAAEKYQVEEYARIVGITRKVIVNDDLGAFTLLPERMGRRAADLESDTVWQIIKDNAALADTFALFSSQHGNLGTAGAPSETTLNEMRALLRRQTGLDGAEISLTPVWVFVPPAHETAMEKLLATTRPTQPSEVNPFGPNGRTTLLMDVEPRLETGTNGSLTSWFGTADKGQIDMIELARLEGTNGPQIQSRDGFDVNGMEIKIMHDIGAKAIDFRGMFKNAGA